MAEAPAEFAVHSGPSVQDPDALNSYLRQYDVFIETTTQMLATPKLHERLLLALEAVTNVFGYQQSAIATVNEIEQTLKIRAAVGFDNDHVSARLEMQIGKASCR